MSGIHALTELKWRRQMKKIAKWFGQCKIKDQIRTAIIALAVFSTVLLGVLSYFLSKHIIERNYQEDFSYNLEISDEITDIQLNNIIELTRNLLVNPSFMSVFKESAMNENKDFSSTERHTLESYLGRIATQETLIGEIIVLDKTGKLYTYSANSGESVSYHVENVLETSWVKEMNEAGGKEVFYGQNILNPDKNRGMVSMGKLLVDPGNYEGIGYMVVNIRQKIFEKAFGSTHRANQSVSFMVVDDQKDNGIIYFRGNEEDQEQIEQEYFRESGFGNQFVFASVENDPTGWKMVSIIRKSELTRDSNVIGAIIMGIILMLVVLGFYISRFISGKIYEPLRKLENTIEEVGEGNRNITEEFDSSEVGQIGNKFKQMVNNNLELRERLLSSELKERESELLLLQSQINPHFLYNTLDSLYCMAVIHEADDMAQMVDALSRTFRLSLNKGNKLIKVADEVAHIKSYMEVQNFRYNNRFALVLDIPADLDEVYILKFILQPFVENAMYHGLEPQIGKGSIRVTAVRETEKIIFTIEDDGVGIAVLSVLENGYGVRNVRERISLFYGEGYGVRFDSEPGVGTKVTVTVGLSYQEGVIANEKSSDR